MLQRRTLLLAPLALLLPVAPALAAPEAPPEVLDLANRFLQHIDAGDYEGAWQMPNARLVGIQEPQFYQLMRANQTMLGPMQERVLKQVEVQKRNSVYGLHYHTKYANKRKAGFEVVNIVRHPNGDYMVVSYTPYGPLGRDR